MILATPNQLHVPQALECIQAGFAVLLVSARDGPANLRVTEAIVAAAESGTTVELSPL